MSGEAMDKSHKPIIPEMISLRIPVRSELSHGGGKVAYALRQTNWNKDRYESVCYVHDLASGRSHQLTRRGDATEFHWVDDNSLAVLKTDGSDPGKPQVWL